MADELGLTRRSLREWLRDPERKITADFVVLISQMWKLPYFISGLLLESAGISLNRKNARNRALEYIRTVMWDQGIEKANCYLKENNMEPKQKLCIRSLIIDWDKINAMIDAAHDIQRFDKEYDCRYERFVAAISSLYGDGNKESVLDLRSYILKIRIDLERHDVYRIVEVPANLTFHDLHRAIVEMFDWSGCHCHSFDVIEGDLHTPGPRYVMPIKTTIYDGDNPPDDELMGSDRAYLSDRTVILSDVFRTEDWCVYTYDFGDNWEHTITVEERKETGGSDRIRVIEANGQRPPEDVGGEYGYEEYLRIISDPDDPDHESAVQWGEEANPEELSLEDMNLRLSLIRF